VERISSRQNAVVKRFRALMQAGAIDGAALLDGVHLLEEAIAAGVGIEVAAFSEPLISGALASLAERAEAAHARIVAVPPQVLSSISPVRHPSGVVAIARLRRAALDDVLAGSQPLLVVLHEVQDPGNVGATIRAAEGCGASGVVTTSGTADPFAWKSLRGSMGSAFRLPIATGIPLAALGRALDTRGIALIAAVPRGGTPLPEADLTGAAAILLGGEGAGLPPDVVARAHARLTIPMKAPVESLNVAIAASLILYEAARQRRH
jgi:RNA methyltransferase, TrmH family